MECLKSTLCLPEHSEICDSTITETEFIPVMPSGSKLEAAKPVQPPPESHSWQKIFCFAPNDRKQNRYFSGISCVLPGTDVIRQLSEYIPGRLVPYPAYKFRNRCL